MPGVLFMIVFVTMFPMAMAIMCGAVFVVMAVTMAVSVAVAVAMAGVFAGVGLFVDGVEVAPLLERRIWDRLLLGVLLLKLILDIL